MAGRFDQEIGGDLDTEYLSLLLIKRVYDKIVSDLPVLIAECRGPRGFDGKDGTDGKDGIDGRDFSFEEHEAAIREIITAAIPKFDDLTEEQKASLRGQDGKDGRDFSFEEHLVSISEVITSHINSISESLKLKFSNLTEEEKLSLRGKDGKDFNFEENKISIESMIAEYVESISARLKLKFSDLTPAQIEQLRGPAGQDGKDFDFEAHKEFVKTLPIKIEDLSPEQRESLRLKFADLTPDERDSLRFKFEDLTLDQVASLRGARGQKGQAGRDFIWEEHEDKIIDAIKKASLKFSDLTPEDKDSLRLKFEDLTLEQVQSLKGKDGDPGEPGKPGRPGKDFIFDEHKEYFDSLKLKFSDLTQEEKDSLKMRMSELTQDELALIRGPRGQRGTPGDPGKDAPTLSKVYVLNGHDSFRFVFSFSDKSSVTSEKISIKLPEPKPYKDANEQKLKNIVCTPDVMEGCAVRLADVNSVMVAQCAVADCFENSNFFGFAEKVENGRCDISFGGITSEIFANLDPTKTYYLSDEFAGHVVDFPPVKSGSVRVRVGQPASSKTMLLRVGEREIIP